MCVCGGGGGGGGGGGERDEPEQWTLQEINYCPDVLSWLDGESALVGMGMDTR